MPAVQGAEYWYEAEQAQGNRAMPHLRCQMTSEHMSKELYPLGHAYHMQTSNLS